MGLSTLDPAPATVEVSLAFLDELREKAKVVAWLEREAATAKACGDGQVSWALLHGRDAISRNEHRAEAGEKP